MTEAAARTRQAGVVHESVHIGRGVAERTVSWGIVDEAPVQIMLNGQPLVVLMATPADLADLARGVLRTEFGVIEPASIASVQEYHLLGEYRVEVQLNANLASVQHSPNQTGMANSSCGLCGMESLAQLATRTQALPRVHPPAIPDGVVLSAFAQMHQRQPLNALTHSAHAAAWCLPSGEVVLVREDVGRHNALDKLAGAMAKRAIDATDGFVLFTSRVSVEMIQKAAAIGVPLVVAVSAPTALAVRMADSAGITLVAVARDDGFEIFTHGHRVLTQVPLNREPADVA